MGKGWNLESVTKGVKWYLFITEDVLNARGGGGGGAQNHLPMSGDAGVERDTNKNSNGDKQWHFDWAIGFMPGAMGNGVVSSFWLNALHLTEGPSRK